ncbi:MAG TPA: type I-E CRISPR-associated protein Cse1/CasA [Rhodocyclaceae bacterium]|nr:type I-E CRISPR-associated protein Cse1/CasA [Rhodocyclaceae bacterium]
MRSEYSLVDEPWLPVQMGDGTVRSVGLLEAFHRSSEIVALAETEPPSLIAQYRMLLATVHRALVRSRGTWKDSERVTWFRRGLPVGEICAYLESLRERFWLFDAEHPFMQVPALATAEETRDKRKPWTQISLASANGNAPVVFDHAVDSVPASISRQAAITHLLGFLQFTPGGLVKTLRDADKAGALVNTAAVLPVGSTLAQTLCLALHPPPLPGQSQPDLPAWERAPLTLAELRGEPVLATGPNDRYTRQSRAVLLESEPDGQVRWLRFAAGWALGEDPQRPDPMACYRAGSNGLVRVSFTEGRAVWRDLPALVPAPQAAGLEGARVAAVVNWAAGLHRLMGVAAGYPQRLLVAGLASDQAKLLRWRLEQFALPQALLVEPDRARELHAHVALAEELHRQLRAIATDLVAMTLPDPRSKDSRSRARELVERGPLSPTYFATAERELWALMTCIARDEPDEADALWHRALRDAGRLAWKPLVDGLGFSPRALQAEARCRPRLNRLLRQHLPAAFAVPADTQPEEA